ncbi:redoxin domain-containing protein [Leucobacter sp. OH1287]|uniref:redoxin domain-containing protein n=1 Tax=Leucobacter sp. OH1287 TaxID=2491049 RepID=UPI000F5EBB72|nr:redoxin domain-containing protein [Leucobacter sp. OH1287]RRD60465.1 cytochrome c biogenesis protein DipZ [Leucobacter sp. OH1287]
MLVTIVLSLFAGVISVLAPCVLPFLPVIVGGSLGAQSRYRPYLISLGLVVSLLAFTLLLKVSTLAIGVDPRFWSIASGVLVIILGIFMLFPDLWTKISVKFGLGNKSHKLLDRAQNTGGGPVSALLTGAALGPVFSSCSPVYAWVIATVLPAQPVAGFVYISAYCIGMAGMLLAISLLGRKLIAKLGWAANPRGWFQRIVAILFILVGVLVATGVDKKVQAWAVGNVPIISDIEHQLIPKQTGSEGDKDGGSGSTSGSVSGPAAPEFTGIKEWINSDPLTIEGLRGKVVLVDFWTYSCINCIRTQPYLNAWYEQYHDQGFEIVGVHAPEFAFERESANVQRAVVDAEIKYPVALDNDFKTWAAYHNNYWPAKYLIDQDGNVVWSHFGEGEYEEAEEQIRKLLGSSGEKSKTTGEISSTTVGQSPETYLGTQRARGFAGEPRLRNDSNDYSAAKLRDVNSWTLDGRWQVDEESITSEADGASLSYRFSGREMFLVMSGPAGSTATVTVDGTPANPGADVVDGTVQVGDARLYKLVKFDKPQSGATVKITFSKGVKANAFTFG